MTSLYPRCLSFFLYWESELPYTLAAPGVAPYHHTVAPQHENFEEIFIKINVKMALCQHFLGNNMAPNSHVTAVNQSKLGPELARLSLYTALSLMRGKEAC